MMSTLTSYDSISHDHLTEICRIIDSTIKRLNDLSSVPYSKAFRMYNGSERHGRLKSLAKELGDAANAMFVEAQLNRTITEQQLLKIICSLSAFSTETSKFSASDGRYYLGKLCSRCNQFLVDYKDHVLGVQAILENGPSFADSLRNIDYGKFMEGAPVSTLQLTTETWEMWATQGKEAISEVQRVSEGYFESFDPIDSSESMEEPKTVAADEQSLAQKAYVLLRLVKTMIRKIRLRCIQPLFEPIEKIEIVEWIDKLMEEGEFLFPAIDEFATAVMPSQSPTVVCQAAIALVKISQRVCELGKLQSGQEEHMRWFTNCFAQLDFLLLPILESNPSR